MITEQKIELRKAAEKSLLGAVLMSALSPDCILPEVKQQVRPEDFHDYKLWHHGTHARIYAAMVNCPQPTELAVAQELQRQNMLQVGDCKLLCDLVIDALDRRSYCEWEEAIAIINPGGDVSCIGGAIL